MNERCDCCGRFINPMVPGSSYGQTWKYSMDGSPDLNDPEFRCPACTVKYGIPDTNCVGAGYNGYTVKPTDLQSMSNQE